QLLVQAGLHLALPPARQRGRVRAVQCRLHLGTGMVRGPAPMSRPPPPGREGVPPPAVGGGSDQSGGRDPGGKTAEKATTGLDGLARPVSANRFKNPQHGLLLSVLAVGLL